MTNDPQPLSLDFAADETLSGFRLKRLELFNWGTFDGPVWSLVPNGQNCLVTGEIGSGKSTLVDAITTLLVPAHRIAYNKAAGAEFKERSLRSYVLGYYRSERNENTGVARPVGLRDEKSYSAILAVFHNVGFEQTITLACVFWLKDPQGQPTRFYVASEKELSIQRDLAHFGGDMNQLRKRLRSDGAEVLDSFPPYSAWFRRRFGIENEQALDLFHQTVSMKSVGNLTEFVRGHMLEPFDIESRITSLIGHFDDLDRAHEAVLKAKRQIDQLTPLAADCDRYAEVFAEAASLREARDWLKPYFASLKLDLLEKRLTNLGEELDRQNRRILGIDEKVAALRNAETELRGQIAENGGDRVERLAAEIKKLETERNQRREKATRYEELVKALGEPKAADENAFVGQHRRIEALKKEAEALETDLQNKLTEDGVAFAQGRNEHAELSEEIASLKARQSNISFSQIQIRNQLCAALDLPADEMPFAGELLQVRDVERDWEGAAERLLHNFALSLLVPEEFYPKVMEWVDRTHLKGRLVYFRVRKGARPELPALHPDSLVSKLTIKPDSPFYPWLDREIAHRFDFACCATHDQFRRESKAITQAGQIKTQGERHEKNDHHRIDDRSRYVLGWSNAAKIAALEEQKNQLENRLNEIGARISRTQAEQGKLRDRLTWLSRLEEYREFREVDWASIASKVQELIEEKTRLESASDVLRELTSKLRETTNARAQAEEELAAERTQLGGIQEKRRNAEALREETLALAKEVGEEALQERVEGLTAMRHEALGEHQLTVESCDNRERTTRDWLQGRIDAKDKSLTHYRDKIVAAMKGYCAAFPVETQEVDASMDSAEEFRGMLTRLLADDLPRFETRFKELLNQNTIREIANFSAHLNQVKTLIKERVERINQSLNEIDYNPNRYIVLEVEPAPDADIRDFQSELRACTEGALTGSEDSQYSEAKFIQVKRIIERFRGREGQTDLDRRWTRKVTDVRNWFTFAASERWREDGKEYEHYSDSGGKSGGQKEKLAYTILAASLAYQFGLEWGQRRSRSFRFVVIDEAFGRGSDESAHYGLRLFAKLNMQLLIVTPLQKIHVIEPYVASVGFVHNDQGQSSRLRNLSIEAYRAEKAKYA